MMLIEFRVRNFRSFRDEQVFSLVALKNDKTFPESTLLSGIQAAPALLCSAAIYGPNAGGKSNLIKALQSMRTLVEISSSLMPDQSFDVQPFRLDVESISQPVEFEITFILDGIRHQYGFSLNAQRIVSEHLSVYKASKPQQWFIRHYNPETNQDDYEFSISLKGDKRVWETATRANSLFLSMAVQLNSIQLRPIFDWFVNKLVIFNDMSPLNQGFTIGKLQQSQSKQAICNFLNAADMSISDITTITRKVPGKNIQIDHKNNPDNPEISITDREQEVHELQFHHLTKKGKAIFKLTDESMGTQRLLFLSGPVLDIIEKGLILVIDELDRSLHPLFVKQLVELFQTRSINIKGAQLIFTTHDSSLLNPNLFRRDQIWFIEKNIEQNSKLYAFCEFSPRKKEAWERAYLRGRYGAVPFLSDWPQI